MIGRVQKPVQGANKTAIVIGTCRRFVGHFQIFFNKHARKISKEDNTAAQGSKYAYNHVNGNLAGKML